MTEPLGFRSDIEALKGEVAEIKDQLVEHEEALTHLASEQGSTLNVVKDLARQVLQLQALLDKPEEDAPRPALRLVPTDPSDVMLDAGLKAVGAQIGLGWDDMDFSIAPVWDAMLKACEVGPLVPFAWRAKAQTGGWIVFYSQEAAEAQADKMGGGPVQPLYVLQP